MRSARLRTLLLSTTASLLLPSLAFAQGAAQPSATEAAPAVLPELQVQGAAPAVVGYQPLRTSLGAGVDTPILDIPQSIAVVPRQALQDQDARSLDEALGNVSGITQTNTLGATQDAFLRRGFGDNRDGSIMVDGLRTVWPRSLNATTDRVEVLKGPASALYGILDPGGMVNVIIKRPELTFGGSLTGRWSSFGGGSTGFDVTGPLGANGFAFRIIGDWQDQDYWRNFGYYHRNLIAPSLTWYGENTTIEASYAHEQYAVPFDRGTIFDLTTGKPVNVSRERRFDERYNIQRGYSDYASLRLTHRLNADWTVSAAYAYSLNNYADQQARVTDYYPLTGNLKRRADATEDSTMFSHALRTDIAGSVTAFGLRHDLLFGTSYDYTSTRRADMVRGTDNTSFNIYDPVYGVLAPPGRNGTPSESDQFERLETYAFYMQDAIHLSDRWIFIAGLRYTTFDDIAGKGRPRNLNTDVNADRWTPRLGLVYKLSPDVSLFASYSQSFKPNSSIASVYGSPPPETGVSWEAGIKADLARGLTLTASAFNITKQNVAYSTGSSTNDILFAGKVRSRGVELDLAGQLTERLSLIGSLALMDVEVLKDDNAALVGNRPQNVANTTGSLFLAYDAGEILGDDRFRFGGGGRYMGKRPGDAANDFYMPAYTVFDAFASYDTQIDKTPIRLQLNVKNIFDRTYYTSSVGTNLGVMVGEPFQAIVSATVRF
ncbi:TonB-dependent siderophore receptor [Acetobacteraceae bacterium H6797]|nr:TonB-dependent siderophore receptor [Acetobacteraceae bacterium H6797]